MVTLTVYVTGARVVVMTEGPLPKICLACLTAPAEPLDYRGSRYGHITTFPCERCGAIVTMNDGDCRPPILYYAAGTDGREHRMALEPAELYRVDEASLQHLERLIGGALMPADPESSHWVEAPFDPMLQQLVSYVSEHRLTRQSATVPLAPGIPVPEPFRTWLDLYATVKATNAT